LCLGSPSKSNLNVWWHDATLFVYFSLYFITYIHTFIQSHSYNTFIRRHSLRPLSKVKLAVTPVSLLAVDVTCATTVLTSTTAGPRTCKKLSRNCHRSCQSNGPCNGDGKCPGQGVVPLVDANPGKGCHTVALCSSCR
jgi:hypothetical protein